VTIKVQLTTQSEVRVGFPVRMNNLSQALSYTGSTLLDISFNRLHITGHLIQQARCIQQ